MTNKHKLTSKPKNWLLSAHILFMIAWFGGTLCLFTLTVVASRAGTGDELYVTYLNMNVIDDVFIKFPALGTLLTGFLLCVLTNWGLTNYYWIIVKELLTLSIIAFGIFGMDQWLDEATALSTAAGGRVVHLPDYAFTQTMLLIGALLNIIPMAAMVVISYLKPWGRRKQQKEPTNSDRSARVSGPARVR